MQKQKIAVIGGGVGAITTVYAITQTPDWQTKYDITVYQLGWRIGGKGASGRNAEHGQRIEEHGLHIWAGFYDNAFRNMRACYDQLNSLGLRAADAPLGSFDQAFKPLSHLFLAENVGSTWRPWVIDLPTNDRPVGSETEVPGPFAMLQRILGIAAEFLEKDELSENALGLKAPPGLHLSVKKVHSHALGMAADGLKHAPADTNLLADLIRAAQKAVQAAETPANMEDDGYRRALMLLEIMLAYGHGVVTSDTFVSGYDILDQWEFTDWLRMNGASQKAVDYVAIRGCYDFVFGFAKGNTERQGDVGAGTAIRAMARLIFTYSTAIFHKMQAGMGDTIFGPYYQVLSAMGVRFEFFNAARELHLNSDKTAVQSIRMVRQAKVKAGTYQPLVDVKGLPCWPSEPQWDQLANGAELKALGVDFESEESPPTGTEYYLERGEDFDLVVLGASLGSLPYLTPELSEASPRWAKMLEKVQTVGTHAAQYWLNQTAEELGWDGLVAQHNAARALPPSPMQTVITGFAEPLDTWADMSHLLPREDWADQGPQSLAYFCAPAPDGETLEDFTQRVRGWNTSDLTTIWPKAKKGKGLDGGIFYPSGKNAFDQQYLRVNMFGSERYVLSVTGSVFHRLAPDESGFPNLFLAGDWTRCGMNAGCVEGATMSGIAAASAVTGVDLPNVGADDIPDASTVNDQAAYLSNSISRTSWPLTPFFARGEMTGWFMFYYLPREQVQALLADGIHLGPAPGAPPGMHPVGLSFCRYQNVRGSFLPGFTAMSPYGEATYAIPYTLTDQGGRAPLLYPRKLYVNNKTAIWAGKFWYAMPKSPAEITVTDSRFVASDDKGMRIEAEFEQQSDMRAFSTHPAFGAISDMLDLTFVTRKANGVLRYNAFNLEMAQAFVAPVHARVKVSDPDPNGFAPVDQAFRPLEGGEGLPGAFRIWCSWSLGNPFASGQMLNAAKARAFIRQGG
ncbi:NAD(P)-binding protein [Neogemmobacter tilapiae]|uniref:Amine oxidase domain-containing protein n=1 Tax=Neogemmobacter tilapiae TaxID=875041 RepID=A0A918WP89_9RHOB|nr:NAD(P)-binding protein [Gemmobacter tilapiae]GHC64727.1 hypothetical protein GCM10007315_31540 [Gemmobacter tilapiae]